MPDLIAQGPGTLDRWRRELPDPASGHEIKLGRADADWNVSWDTMVSRHHVRLIPIAHDRLRVTKILTARNAVFHRGKSVTQLTLVPGDHFVIGKTTFTLVNRPGASDAPVGSELTEHAYDLAILRKRHFRDAAARIEMLGRLPDLITGSGSDEELLVRVTGVLLQASPEATAVAVVRWQSEPRHSNAPATDLRKVEILHYDSRVMGPDDLPISARLVRDAITKRESLLHLWSGNREGAHAFTASEEVDWAYCVPLRSDACPGWALYVTGNLATDPSVMMDRTIEAAPENLMDDVKFTELVGTTIANLRQSLRLQRRQTEMRHFFAPVVLEALANRDPDEILKPREMDLSVLFCDLRGFSTRSEQDADDLLRLLDRVSGALGVMTRHILNARGVIGDFHGDAAMGFWGWPLEQDDAVGRAVEAATQIRQSFCHSDQVGGFRCGIGIATGRAVAGRIGTVDQVKVTAFGPVVNLASRLEGMTKNFGVEIIADLATTKWLADHASDDFTARRLGEVKPQGFENALPIFEIGDRRRQPGLSPEEIALYEECLESLQAKNWKTAADKLLEMPPNDGPTQSILKMIAKYGGKPPADWDGCLE